MSIRARVAAAVAAVACLAAGGSLTLAAPAGAAVRTTTLGDARARAAALRTALAALQTKAELATEAYNAAYDALGRAVTANLQAQAAVDRASLTVGTAGRTAERRVRALYISGGAPALYASVLQATTLSDIFERLASVRAVVGGDRTAASAAERSVVDKTAALARLAALADRQTRLQADVASRGDAVRSLLAQTAGLLAGADARVRQLAEEEQRAAEAAAARAAADALARAQLSAAGAGPVAAPSAAAEAAIAEAERHLGQPYLWGGTGPAAYDCSGLTMTAYRAAGVALPRTAAEQWGSGPQVSLGDLAPGDLLFWAGNLADPATIHHVAMYLGNGQMIAAPHTGSFVQVQPLYLTGYLGAVRPAATVGPTGRTAATVLDTPAPPS